MDPEERKVQNALGSLNTYNVYMTIDIAATNTYLIQIKSVNEEEAIARAKALVESDNSIDDLGKDYFDTCQTDYDPTQEFGEPEFEILED